MKFYKKYVLYLPNVWGGFSSGPVLISVNSTRSPVSVFGATVMNTIDQLINNRKLFLVGLEAGESQDHQQVPRLVRPVSWFLDCLLLLPVLAAWQPIPS